MTQNIYYHALVGSCDHGYYFEQTDLGIFIYGEEKQSTIQRGRALIKLKAWDILEHYPEKLPYPRSYERPGAELCKQAIKVEDELYAQAFCVRVVDASKALGISKQRVYHLVKTHLLDSVKLKKRHLYITKASIEARMKLFSDQKYAKNLQETPAEKEDIKTARLHFGHYQEWTDPGLKLTSETLNSSGALQTQ